MPHWNVNRYTEDYLRTFRTFFLFWFCLLVCLFVFSLIKTRIAHIHSTLGKTNHREFSYLIRVHQLELGEFFQSFTKMELYVQNPIPRFYSFSHSKILISQKYLKKKIVKKKIILLALPSDNLGILWIKLSLCFSHYSNTCPVIQSLGSSRNKKWISNLVH